MIQVTCHGMSVMPACITCHMHASDHLQATCMHLVAWFAGAHYMINCLWQADGRMYSMTSSGICKCVVPKRQLEQLPLDGNARAGPLASALPTDHWAGSGLLTA